MESGIGGTHAEIAMTLGLRAHNRDLGVVVGDGPLHISHVGNRQSSRELLIALVHPLRLASVIRDNHRLEARVRGHAERNVVMLDRAEDRDAELVRRLRRAHIALRPAGQRGRLTSSRKPSRRPEPPGASPLR